MRVIAKSTLINFWEDYPKLKQSLLSWNSNFLKGNYRNANEVISIYRNADVVGNGRIVFNICCNDYRLIVKFDYVHQFTFIRFIGTHKEYDKINDIKNI